MDKKNIAFFDFDGTIIDSDSFIEFIIMSRGRFSFYKGIFLLSPSLLKYKLNLIPNYIAKEKLFSYFFKDMDENEFNNYARKYSLNQIDKIVKEEAKKKIEWHKRCGDEVVIVSASIENWIEPWCRANNVNLIATKIKIRDGIITGEFLSKNCYGIEKANRIKKIYNLNLYKSKFAYGDSSGDIEMLNLADKDKRFYRCF